MSKGAHDRNYVKIWAILVVLLIISVIGPTFGIRVVTLIAAFGVAGYKAFLVAKNFMHLDIEKPIVHWILVTAVVFMVLLFAGVAPDVMKDDGLRWQKDEGFHPEVSGEQGDPSGHGEQGSESDQHDGGH
jgi:caa(3)-type oxidase subunit IV